MAQANQEEGYMGEDDGDFRDGEEWEEDTRALTGKPQSQRAAEEEGLYDMGIRVDDVDEDVDMEYP